MVYLDHAATTATHPEVIKEMLPFFQDVYSNPSGSYEFAADSRLMLERARKVIADSIHAKPEEIFFTGSGTEADNWALVGMARLKKEQGKHIITSTIEHHAILRTCQYLEKKGYEIHVTGKGKQLLELVPSELKKPELTAAWEMKLSGIAKGNLQEKAFIEEISDYTEELIREIKAGTQIFRHDNLTNKKCPQCGKRLLAVNGKNSKMLVCQDRECGYRETLSRTSNARCPKCHKKMELYGKGEDQTFICKCGYKEKLSAFKNRREKEGAGVSKRDVQSYLKKQQKEAAEPLNNAFAAAFAKLDIK